MDPHRRQLEHLRANHVSGLAARPGSLHVPARTARWNGRRQRHLGSVGLARGNGTRLTFRGMRSAVRIGRDPTLSFGFERAATRLRSAGISCHLQPRRQEISEGHSFSCVVKISKSVGLAPAVKF